MPPLKDLQGFGGDWTEKKLEMLRSYLHFYATALKEKPSKERPFELCYIDAFAGTGYREVGRASQTASNGLEPLFADLEEEETQKFLDGSARIALKSDPPFHRYVFIEKNAEKVAELEHLRTEFSKANIEIVPGDANSKLTDLCKSWEWNSRRAVLFLDPYGMALDWNTLVAVAKTEAIDVWILFPLGQAVNRMLTQNGQLSPGWEARLTRFFGTDDWKAHFYPKRIESALFGEEELQTRDASFERIAAYFRDRLESIFPAVAKAPKLLYNSRGVPIYMLTFAIGNPSPKAIGLALKVAKHILEVAD